MTNLDLLLKIKKEIPDYQIGFHTVDLTAYKNVITFAYWKTDKYRFDGVITEESITSRILEKGLNVSDVPFGLRSTTTFPEELTPETFDYNYYSNKERVCNLILAIPYYITYNGKPYFIGDLVDHVNVGNMILFNRKLPPEFIYGYYTKDIIGFSKDEILYPHDLQFHENSNFFGKLDYEKQQEVIKRVVRESKWGISSLKLSNSRIPSQLILHPRRYIIAATKEQHKQLILK